MGVRCYLQFVLANGPRSLQGAFDSDEMPPAYHKSRENTQGRQWSFRNVWAQNLYFHVNEYIVESTTGLLGSTRTRVSAIRFVYVGPGEVLVTTNFKSEVWSVEESSSTRHLKHVQHDAPPFSTPAIV